MSEESALNLEEEEKKVKKKILQILNRKVQMIKDYRNLIQVRSGDKMYTLGGMWAV